VSTSTSTRAAERSTEQRFQTLFDQAPFSDGGQAGFDHDLVKPADLDELARLVQHA
jgi:hypothetical protein